MCARSYETECLLVVQLECADVLAVAQDDGEEAVELGFFEVLEVGPSERGDDHGHGVGVGDDERGV